MLLLNLSSIADSREDRKGGGSWPPPVPGGIGARPDLPTMAEAGVPGFPDFGVVVHVRPGRTCRRSWRRRFTPTSARCWTCRKSKEFFEKNSFERVTLSPPEFAKLVADDSKNWEAIIKQVGAKID